MWDRAAFESLRPRSIEVNRGQPCAIADTPTSDILRQLVRSIEVNRGHPRAIADTPTSDILRQPVRSIEVTCDNPCLLINTALSKPFVVSHFIPYQLKKPSLTESTFCVQSIPTPAKLISVIWRSDVRPDLLARMRVALAPLIIIHVIDKWQCSYKSIALLSIECKLCSHINLSALFPTAVSRLHMLPISNQLNKLTNASSPNSNKRDMSR